MLIIVKIAVVMKKEENRAEKDNVIAKIMLLDNLTSLQCFGRISWLVTLIHEIQYVLKTRWNVQRLSCLWQIRIPCSHAMANLFPRRGKLNQFVNILNPVPTVSQVFFQDVAMLEPINRTENYPYWHFFYPDSFPTKINPGGFVSRV